MHDRNNRLAAQLEILVDYHERLATAFSATSSSELDALLMYTKHQLQHFSAELEQGIAAAARVQAELDAVEMSREWTDTLDRIRLGFVSPERPDAA